MASLITHDALVVDDDLVNRLIAARMLEKLGWTVAASEDGEKALSFLSEKRVTVVLLDISMPRMSGHEVCQRIRDDIGDDIKVIAYTAHAQPEDRRSFLDFGFDALLVKPITRERLVEVLNEVGLQAEVH